MFGGFDQFEFEHISAESFKNYHELIDTLLKLNEARDLDKICEIIDKYLQKYIKGVGCSIFLMDPTTNELRLIYSKIIDEKDWKNAVYQVGEGFTGWVAKYKKFLYIKDEEDIIAIQQIYPKPPKHSDQEKPHETDKIGPFMAAPILNRGSNKLDKGDFKDLKAFIDKLFDENIPLSKFIRNKLSPEILSNFDKSKDFINNDKIIDSFINELNSIFENELCYKKELFRDVLLSKETEEFLSNVPKQKEDILFVNRQLLGDIYKDELAKCYVLGVIRLPNVVDNEEEYTEYEKRLFKYFAIRLSQSIENANIVKKHNNLISIYRNIGDYGGLDKGEGNIEKLFEVVKYIPEIVGGGYCTIFTIEDGKIAPKSTTSTSRKFLQIIKNSKEGNYIYNINGPGLTAWAARNKKAIRIDDISDVNEIKKIDPNLIALRPIVEIDYDDVGPFLAVPIIREGNCIGVIRVLRHKRARPFESVDEMLLTGSADLLSLALLSISRNEELKACQLEAKAQCHSKFSRILTEKGIKVSEISYAKEINAFFETAVKGEIAEKIKESLDTLWKMNYGMVRSLPLLSDFKYFEDMLLELPGYRDHFIHQFQVFILGSIIIDDIYRIGKEKKKKTFLDYYSGAINGTVTKQQADFAWLIASSFHDIAYPIEKSDEIFNNFFSHFMGIKKPIIQGTRLDNLIYDRGYMRLIDNLFDFYVSVQHADSGWTFNGNDDRSIRVNASFNQAVWSHLLEKRDHGVFGALILLHQSLDDAGGENFSTVIYPAALAICLHNKLLFDLQENIVFEKNPLAFLLRFCDLAQEWGRGKDIIKGNPNLSKIDVNYDESDSKIHVSVEISLGNADAALNKEDEARKVFGRLSSNDIVFELRIYETGNSFFLPHR